MQALTLLTTTGEQVPLSALWADGPVVTFFVRHFGCVFCREQVAEVRAARADFERAGARVVVVGQGSVEDAAAFAREFGDGLEVLTDPTRETYCALGMRRGWRTAATLGTVKRAAQALAKGFRQAARVQGDPFQQPESTRRSRLCSPRSPARATRLQQRELTSGRRGARGSPESLLERGQRAQRVCVVGLVYEEMALA